MHNKTKKSARIDIRTTPETKQDIERKAAQHGVKTSEYMIATSQAPSSVYKSSIEGQIRQKMLKNQIHNYILASPVLTDAEKNKLLEGMNQECLMTL